MAGSTKPLFFRAADAGEAYRARANRFLHTTYVKRGAVLRLDSKIENSNTHKQTDPRTNEGDALTSVTALARNLSPAATAFSSQNLAAVEAWGRGDFAKATEIDADFGGAWVALVQQLAVAKKNAEALQAAERGFARPTLRSEWHRAQLRLTITNAKGDLPGSMEALRTLAQLAPGDSGILLLLAQAESRLRDSASSTAHLRKVLEGDPANPQALLSLGYAEGAAGRLESAKTILMTYGREANQGAQQENALDSLGEVHFMNGKFAEAAGYFHQLYSHDAGFLGGAPLRKAAFAEWLGGNLPGADATLSPYFSSLKARDASAGELAEAAWLHVTGREKDAIAKLSAPSVAQTETVKKQLAVWNGQITPPADEATLKKLYESAPSTNDGMIRVFYADALVKAGKTSEASALLQRWPLPDDGDPVFQSLMFTRFRELRKTLGIQ